MANGLMPTSGATPTPTFSRNRGRELQGVPLPGHPGAGMGGGGPSGIVPPHGDAGLGSGIAEAGAAIGQGAANAAAMRFRAAESAADRKFHLKAIERKHELDRELQREGVLLNQFVEGSGVASNLLTGYASQMGELFGLLAEGGEVPESLAAQVLATQSRLMDAGLSLPTMMMEGFAAGQSADPTERARVYGQKLGELRDYTRRMLDPKSAVTNEDGTIDANKAAATAEALSVTDVAFRIFHERAKRGQSAREATKAAEDTVLRFAEKQTRVNNLAHAMIGSRMNDEIGITEGVSKRGAALGRLIVTMPADQLRRMPVLDVFRLIEQDTGNPLAEQVLKQAGAELRPENFRLGNYLKTGFSDALTATFRYADTFMVPAIQGLRDPAAGAVTVTVKDENGNDVQKTIPVPDSLGTLRGQLNTPESQEKIDIINDKLVAFYSQALSSNQLRTEFAERKVASDMMELVSTIDAIERMTGEPLSGEHLNAVMQRVLDSNPGNADAIRAMTERFGSLQDLLSGGVNEVEMMETIRGR